MAGVQSMDANKKNYYEVNGPSINAYTPYREGDVEETASRERMFSGEPPGTRTQGPRLKSTTTAEENQCDDSSEPSNE
jgi:hypothetical protein